MHTLLVLGTAFGISFLILLKTDKQIVHILEGRLHAKAASLDAAGAIYKKHLNSSSSLLFIAGVMLGSFCAVRVEGFYLVVCLLLSAILIAFGAIGRMRSFRAAANEIGSR